MKHYKLNLLTLALATAGFSAASYADQQATTETKAPINAYPLTAF